MEGTPGETSAIPYRIGEVIYGTDAIPYGFSAILDGIGFWGFVGVEIVNRIDKNIAPKETIASLKERYDFGARRKLS